MGRADFFTDADADSDLPKSLTCSQQVVLERAVAKVILLGIQAGVTVDQMILWLESGMTVRELLGYLGAEYIENA
jgi:hypothetical protein